MLEAATTLNLFAQIPITGDLSVVARAENIFDETIVTRNARGAIDLGVPQTFWFGLRLGL